MTTNETFRHQAHIYRGHKEFVDHMSDFIIDGLNAREPVLVLVIEEKIDLLKTALSQKSDDVLFGDMTEIGRNPSRIIPRWREFMDEYGQGGRVRGIGEPIWAGRTPDELLEAQRHEALINLAFDGAAAWILCPYDEEALPPEVIEEAGRSHPFVSSNGSIRESEHYVGLSEIGKPFRATLPEPPPDVETLFLEGHLNGLRELLSSKAEKFGLERARMSDFVLAANEVATNSLRHGDGAARVKVWSQGDSLICEVRDGGFVVDPLAGRIRPRGSADGGLGLWLVNQLCDLVQVRTYDSGTIVRMHFRRQGATET